MLNMVTDRTFEDVIKCAELLKKYNNGTITPKEMEEFSSEIKGFYNASDINRVVSAMKYLSEVFKELGYIINVESSDNWAQSDYFNSDGEYAKYLSDIKKIRNVVSVSRDTPTVPPEDENLDYSKANDIEKIIVHVDLLSSNMKNSGYYSGEIFSGEL